MQVYRYYKLRKTFCKFYCRHSELMSKYNEKKKKKKKKNTLLHEGM